MLEWMLGIAFFVLLALVIRVLGRGVSTDLTKESGDITGVGFENWVGPKSLDPRNPASLVNNNPDDKQA